MNNSEIARILYNIADLLELQNVKFKPVAYRNAARSINDYPNLGSIYDEEGLKGLEQIPAVGKNIALKIEELIKTGKLKYYKELQGQFPTHIPELMGITGLGPKRINLLHQKLGIKNLKDLEQAAKAHKIRNIARFGEKSELEILNALRLHKSGNQRMLLGYALAVAEEIVQRLSKNEYVEKTEIAGSIRRKKETIGDIDILAISKNPGEVMEYFTQMPQVSKVLAKGKTKSSILIRNNMQVDLRIVEAKSYGAALMYFTGSKEHNVVLRDKALRNGMKLNEYGLFKKDKIIAGKTENEIYKKFGLQYIVPEMRENRGEISLAEKNKLPTLIGYSDLKGDIHTHTKKTDGVNKPEDMATEAKKLGHQYIAITDHSKSTTIAHGLSEDEMKAHLSSLRKIKIQGIKVLVGSEVDILPDGELDYNNELLKKMDIVVASAHSRFKSNDMTERLLNALDNEHIDILGHPTGRKIGVRKPYEFDKRKVFGKAAEKKIWLEINSHPERTDLNDLNIIEAKKHGCKFVINTDAHSLGGLHQQHLGIAAARRGWLEKKDVINTCDAKELGKYFKKIS